MTSEHLVIIIRNISHPTSHHYTMKFVIQSDVIDINFLWPSEMYNSLNPLFYLSMGPFLIFSSLVIYFQKNLLILLNNFYMAWNFLTLTFVFYCWRYNSLIVLQLIFLKMWILLICPNQSLPWQNNLFLKHIRLVSQDSQNSKQKAVSHVLCYTKRENILI